MKAFLAYDHQEGEIGYVYNQDEADTKIAELEVENVHHKNNIEQLLNEKKTDRADAIREMLDEVLKTFDSYDASDLMAEIWDYADNLEGESDG